MNFGLVFAKIALGIGIYAGAAGLLWVFRRVDEELKNCGEKSIHKNWFIYSTLVCIPMLIALSDMHPAPWFCIGILGVYLAVSSVTDALIFQVYDVLQYMGVIGGGILLGYQNPDAGKGVSLLVFAAIQYLLFMRLYGKADGMGYCICALYLSGKGYGLEGYLYHMLIGFFLLTLVQLLRGNITCKGNLQQPIALFPYITIGFLILWCCT